VAGFPKSSADAEFISTVGLLGSQAVQNSGFGLIEVGQPGGPSAFYSLQHGSSSDDGPPLPHHDYVSAGAFYSFYALSPLVDKEEKSARAYRAV
jgi:hypothetical protein